MTTPPFPADGGAPRALVFSDMQDSTALATRTGEAAAADAWARHDRRARDLLALHDGREIGRSDGMYLMFESPAAAVRYALDYQAATRSLGFAARVGVHFGEVRIRANLPADVARGALAWEVDGIAIATTARLMALAGGGQTLASSRLVEAVAGRLPAGCRVQRHGFYRLKGIDAPLEVHEIGDASCSFVPPPDADKAYRVVAEGDQWVPLRDVRTNLAPERDAFVGRSGELRFLAERIEQGARLVTVQGPAGAGKTRLARRFAALWRGDWPGGTWFCDLSEARTPEGTLSAVASALSVPLARGDAVAQLGHAIAGRGACLLILDNLEQVVGPIGDALGPWLDLAPQATFLATSRERLQLPGEDVLPLEPLPLDSDAIELFVIRARAQDPRFDAGPGNRAAIGKVVRLLDGLPLAIELAAARARMFAPAELAERLHARFELLAAARGRPTRQATLRAAIDWSWNLLVPAEQSALALLAVFEGTFTLDAAEAVVDGAALPGAPPLLDVMQALVDKSLLRSHPARQGTGPSLSMYLSVQAYAREQLDAQGHEARLQAERRHGTHYATLGSDEALLALSRPGGMQRAQRLGHALDNLVVACERAVARQDAACAAGTLAAAWRVFDMRGPVSKGVTLGAAVAHMPAVPPERLKAMFTYATALRRAARPEEARAVLEDVRRLAEAAGNRRVLGRACVVVGHLCADQYHMDAALTEGRTAMTIAHELADRDLEADAARLLGIVSADQDRLDDALAHFQAALERRVELGDRRGEAAELANLANLKRMRGEVDDAIAWFERALDVQDEVGDLRIAAIARGNLGSLYAAVGRSEDAVSCCKAALAIHRDVGNVHAEATVHGELANLFRAAGHMRDARLHYAASLRQFLEIGDRERFVAASCDSAEAEVGAGESGRARAVLSAAAPFAADLDAQGGSPASRRFATLVADPGAWRNAAASYDAGHPRPP